MAEAKETKAKTSKPAKKKTEDSANNILTYNGKPLLRCGNEIYYGKPEDKYVVIFHSISLPFPFLNVFYTFTFFVLLENCLCFVKKLIGMFFLQIFLK